ncbi:hypothetical protein ACJMK2_011490 [Sinanodonta woodiana]|uniref:Uncharacterized protein n=1 Tax=Sinanodonta woodiana TaxID=1069815 RepID=A0ABD3V6Y6_SINWO
MPELPTSQCNRLILPAENIVISQNSFQSLSGTNSLEDHNHINIETTNRPKRNTIRILSVNCRRLRSESKHQQFTALVDQHQPHIIHATETHLDKQISSVEILDLYVYDIFRKDRNFELGHEGGGVLNAIRKDPISSETNCELS